MRFLPLRSEPGPSTTASCRQTLADTNSRRAPGVLSHAGQLILRLGGRGHPTSHIPAKQRLGQRVGEDRAPVHQRLGQSLPRHGRRHISPPDAGGWREVLDRGGSSRSHGHRAQHQGDLRPRRGVPVALWGKCLNCYSTTHKIASCRRPLRCFKCFGNNHLARDCKQPRSPPNATGGEPSYDRFVRQRQGADSDRTPDASQAGNSTPSFGQAPGHPRSPSVDDREPLPPGHPDERPWEAVCIVQRNQAMDSAEVGLRFAITALVADASRHITISTAFDALYAIPGAQGAFSIKPFYPEHFFVECNTQDARDAILRSSPLPVAGTSLVLLPWTRLAHAEAASMRFKASIELEGIPPHAWDEDTAAKILAPSCWLQSVDEQTRNKSDMSSYKLSAWTSDSCAIPKVVWLYVAENETMVTMNPSFGNLPPYLREKRVLRYRVLIHLRRLTDLDPANPTPPVSPPPSDDDGDGRHDRRRNNNSDRAVQRFHAFQCARRVVDGEPAPPGNAGGGCRWAERSLVHLGHGGEPASFGDAGDGGRSSAGPCHGLGETVSNTPGDSGLSEDHHLQDNMSRQQIDGFRADDPMLLEATLLASHPHVLPMVCATEPASPAPKEKMGALECLLLRWLEQPPWL